MPSQSLQALDEGKSFGELRELGFFRLELTRMDAAPKPAHPDRVLEVKHLMVEQIFNSVARA